MFFCARSPDVSRIGQGRLSIISAAIIYTKDGDRRGGQLRANARPRFGRISHTTFHDVPTRRLFAVDRLGCQVARLDLPAPGFKRPENVPEVLAVSSAFVQEQTDDRNERGELYRRNVWIGTSISGSKGRPTDGRRVIETSRPRSGFVLDAEPFVRPESILARFATRGSLSGCAFLTCCGGA